MVSNTFKTGYVFHTKYNNGIKMEVTGQGIRKKNEREDVVPSIKAVAQWASKKHQEPLLWQAPNFLHIARRSHKQPKQDGATNTEGKVKAREAATRWSSKKSVTDQATNSQSKIAARTAIAWSGQGQATNSRCKIKP